MKVFGITGRSGSGKTTLIVALLPWLQERGLRVSAIKQANPKFDIDTPGKDSYRHREAGAREVMVVSSRRWALMHERAADEPELPAMEALLARMTPVDLVLVEGFRDWPHPRLEVFRPALGKAPFYPDDPRVVAVASDAHLSDASVPVIHLDDVAAIGRLILAQCGLEKD